MKETKKFYVTTSIAYVNAPPHIGYAMELLQADVLARYHRLLGEEVFFLTGTDEHGKKIAEAAAKAGMETQTYVDSVSAQFGVLCRKLEIKYDNFIRTTSKEHRAYVQHVWKHMEERGDIYKAMYEGRYCIGCEAFLREAEMDNGVCHIHKKETQAVHEENYFFRFSKYAAQIEQAIREDTIRILPEFRKKEILNYFSDEGIKDFSVSRPKESVGWGIPVPGDESQIIYVWIDALMNYLSGIDLEESKMTNIWPADVHVIGKDIMRFHTMMLPAFLKSLDYKFPRSIAIHGFILAEGQKMSKSLGNVIDPIAVIAEHGVEPVRYYLLREIPSDGDGDFSFARFKERYTADLQNGLGNLISRVSVLGVGNSEAVKDITVSGIKVREQDIYKEYVSAIDAFQLHRALEHVWVLVEQSNKIVEETRLWELAAHDIQKANEVFAKLALTFASIAYMLAPFLPETAEKIAVAIGTDIAALSGDSDIPVRFQKPATSLFPKLL
ncbi:MAG: class I tRNA ligase family protein [Candidatus Azambacteria bacterium]|nr:class I tRNA ligase family protein [Candidatus Azambacteria bacterium]